MKKYLTLSILTVMTLTLCSCQNTASVKEAEKKKNGLDNLSKISDSPKSLEQVANQYIDNIFAAFKTRNFKQFKKNMTTDMQAKVTRQSFNATCDQFDKLQGEFKSKQFLCIMNKNKGLLKVALWKTKFSKNPNDVLTTLIFGKLDGKYQIFGLYFDK